jgi:hypothetical protein
VASGKKTGSESPPHSIPVLRPKSVLNELALDAVRLGADTIEVEFNYGHKEVVFLKHGSGSGTTFDSSSDQAKSLLKELYSLRRKKPRIASDDAQYRLRISIYDSFGEDAFRIELTGT